MTILGSAIDDVVAFRRVSNRTKPIPRSTTDKCSEHNLKIGPLTDIVATSLIREVATKNRFSHTLPK